MTQVAELRLGTRASPLALCQARKAMEALQASPLGTSHDIVVIPWITTGDKIKDKPLFEVGGKGLFAKELEEALLRGEIDCAVHSLKDVESSIPEGLVLGAYLPREDPRDILITREPGGLEGLPIRAKVGTVSPRRKVLLGKLRPDLEVVPLRGNVGTRLNKLEAGEVDALIMAVAGLKRLGLLEGLLARGAYIFSPEEMLPAAGQGVIALQCREEDNEMLSTLLTINHLETARCVEAERALLTALDGSCRTPVGAYALSHDAVMVELSGMLAREDGKKICYAHAKGQTPYMVGREVAEKLLREIA